MSAVEPSTHLSTPTEIKIAQQRLDSLSRSIALLAATTFTEIPVTLIILIIVLKTKIWLAILIVGLLLITNGVVIRSYMNQKKQLHNALNKNGSWNTMV